MKFGKLVCCLISLIWITPSPAADQVEVEPLIFVVMDPLAAPLAQECGSEHSQRKYEVLSNLLSQELQRPVQLFWTKSLVTLLEDKTRGRADFVIGPQSVVERHAAEASVELRPVAALTDLADSTTQAGLFVVRADDPAQTLADLSGYRIFFGPEECDERMSAALAALRDSSVPLPGQIENYADSAVACRKLTSLEPAAKAAAVVADHSKPILNACGTAIDSDLKVIGASKPVPFITAFSSPQLSAADQAKISRLLLELHTQPDVLKALHSSRGFVPCPQESSPADTMVTRSDDSGSSIRRNL